ncbi:SAM-dependent methyltransferase [Microbacterium resistens]|uniref:SAM-dependent methyltransferase n=1 Tax=Microbacterium resistens TaxID=156977 RepID=A0ABU1SDU8_9MICO|nr:class I SAM-dependent methyltransferase [Microbacterium resistens]MDR6867408.1 SAM-dependent methyltransferase [Microbacterium resistens]
MSGRTENGHPENEHSMNGRSMNGPFDQGYWEQHWHDASPEGALPPHPALETEIAGLAPGTALDAGSGEGAETGWLAAQGWTVTSVDISPEALRRAAARTADANLPITRITRIAADLTTWEPEERFDLVTTFYAHADIPQHALYQRLSRWVAPAGTLLIVGHHHEHGAPREHGHGHPENATTGPELVRDLLDPAAWDVETAEVRPRTVGHGMRLQDVIVRARRRG